MIKIGKKKNSILSRFALVIVVAVIFLIAGLAIGGWVFSKSVLIHILYGVMIGLAIKVAYLLLLKSPVGKSKLMKKLRG